MAIKDVLFTANYFPAKSPTIPFGEILNDLFFDPISDNEDFPLHGPNAIRFTEALLSGEPTRELGLLQANQDTAKDIYMGYCNYSAIVISYTFQISKKSLKKNENIVCILRQNVI